MALNTYNQHKPGSRQTRHFEASNLENQQLGIDHRVGILLMDFVIPPGPQLRCADSRHMLDLFGAGLAITNTLPKGFSLRTPLGLLPPTKPREPDLDSSRGGHQRSLLNLENHSDPMKTGWKIQTLLSDYESLGNPFVEFLAKNM